jgi:site-specific recombinase XerD
MTKIKLKYVHEYLDATGKPRRYVRRFGKRTPLPGIPGSAEFMEAYQRAVSGRPAAPLPIDSKDALVRDLVQRYYAGSKFTNLSASSQQQYRDVIDRYAQEHGHRTVRGLTVDTAEKIIAKIGATRPGLANKTQSILSAMYRYSIKIRLRADNPFSPEAIEPYKLGSHHTWTDEELTAFRKRWPLGTRERLAFTVLLYSGQRVSDAVKLKRTDILEIKQRKTGAELSIPQHPALVRAVKAGPSNGFHIIGDEAGRQITGDGLSRFLRRAIKAAGLPSRCKPHGLRKANQRLLAEGGATAKQMQAISGHRTLRETERYSEKANQAALAVAAIALLPDEE